MAAPVSSSSSSPLSSAESIRFESAGYCCAVLATLNDLRDQREQCDFTLLAEGRSFPCHKAVLIGGCEYFRAMFNSNMRECKKNEVELQNVPPDVLDHILQYLYTGQLELPNDDSTPIADMIKSLLETADLFQLPDLKSQCESRLLTFIDTENCLALQFFAKLHSLDMLQTASIEYMLEHFVEVAKDENFPLLGIDQLIEYIANDRLNTPNEDPVYEAVRIWLLYDWDTRQVHVARVLSHVRFPLCSPQFFLDSIEKDSILSEVGCDEYLREYKEYHLVPEKREQMSVIVRAQPRISQTQQRLVLLGGRDSDWKTLKRGWYLDQGKMQWEELCEIPFENFLFSACSLNNRAYVSGGYRIPHGTSKDLWEYSGYSQRWTRRSDMSVAREDHGSVACCGCVYVMGGTSAAERVLVHAEKYDPELNEWSIMADLLTPVFQPAVAAVLSDIYVIGGTKFDSRELRYTTNMGMQILNTRTNQWTHIYSTMFRITGGCATVLGKRIYLSCGYDKLLCSFDTACNKWEYHSISPLGHCRGRAIMMHGKILLVGGKFKTRDGRYDWTDIIDVYDPITKSWSGMNPPCPKPATDFGAVLLNVAV